MSRLADGINTLWRHLGNLRLPAGITVNALVWLVIVIIFVALLVPAIRNQVEELAGGGNGPTRDASDVRSPGGTGELPTADTGSLSGTWRVFKDESESVPVFDLTFQPDGAAVLLLQSAIRGTVEDWSYTEDGSSVEVALTFRYNAKDGGVYTPHGWLHLTRNGGEMRGSYSGEDYLYEGRDKGMTVHGVKTLWDSVFARPR
jgi:hypothetical protein